jgi:hypothetical protein
MRSFFYLAAGLGLFLTACTAEAPAGPCYSGMVLGETCFDGVLIQVDAAYPIGRPAVFRFTSTDSAGGDNVVAAVNDLGALNKRGQRVYFSYAGSTEQSGPARICPALYAPLAVPHVVLTNVSATSCAD